MPTRRQIEARRGKKRRPNPAALMSPADIAAAFGPEIQAKAAGLLDAFTILKTPYVYTCPHCPWTITTADPNQQHAAIFEHFRAHHHQQPPRPAAPPAAIRAAVAIMDIVVPGVLSHFDSAFEQATKALLPPPAPHVRVDVTPLVKGEDGVYRPKEPSK